MFSHSRATPLTLLAVALTAAAAIAQGGGKSPPKLPEPFATKSVRNSPRVIGWADGVVPKAPAGFSVSLYAKGLNNPRWIYVLPNGDVLISESHGGKRRSANRVTLLRDGDGDGEPETRETFLKDLNKPIGMLLLNGMFYVANTDGVMAYPYKKGQTKIDGKGRLIHALPALGYNQHWTRNLVAGPDGEKIYVSVGSASNVGERGMEAELLRACILEMNPDGTELRVYAGGLRNPVGMAWEPTTKTLWAAVNERDHLGDDLVPDYITSVNPGAFYGWPYSYYGDNVDPRRKGERPDLVKKAVSPDVPLGSHTASLGLAFCENEKWPAEYRGGAFVSQHGSWNRSELAGYRVVFVPFKKGKPSAEPEDFLTGFIKNPKEVHGRPVCTAFAADGSLLVTDDSSNRVWRVAPK